MEAIASTRGGWKSLGRVGWLHEVVAYKRLS